MLRKIGIAALVIVALFVGVLVIAGISSGGERDLARTFMSHLSDGNFAAAQAMMHPSLANEFPGDSLAQAVGSLERYTDISFSGFETDADTGTTVKGTATTDAGCESPVTFTFVSEQMIAFNIDSLCRAQ